MKVIQPIDIYNPFFTRCNWHGGHCNETYFTKATFDMGQCFSFNLDESHHLFTTKTGSQFGLRLVINIEQYEYIRGPSTDAGVKVSMHGCVGTLFTKLKLARTKPMQ